MSKKLQTSTNATNHIREKRLNKGTITFEDDTSIFPSDILFNILIKVPVKSLLRFKSVSKPWNVMISDNEFKKTHRDQSKAFGREKLLLQKRSYDFDFIDLESSQLVKTENQVMFPLKKFQRSKILCSCDGMVLLKNHKAYRNYFLWNPSTRDEFQTLSCHDNGLYYNYVKHQKAHACGLCYDSSVDDFKVILIYELFYVLYSLNKDSWTKKTSFACPVLPPLDDDNVIGGITMEGRVFWSQNEGEFRLCVNRASTIIYYDVKSDEVKSLPRPHFVGENGFFFLTSLKGCVSLYGGILQSRALDIWIMEQGGSWKWLMNVLNLPSICKKFIQDRVLLCCTKNGEILFQGWDGNLLIYNPRQQLHAEAEISKEYLKNRDFPRASVCLDSLYSSSLTKEGSM